MSTLKHMYNVVINYVLRLKKPKKVSLGVFLLLFQNCYTFSFDIYLFLSFFKITIKSIRPMCKIFVNPTNLIVILKSVRIREGQDRK
jgi:hypothetical protein